MDVPLTRSFTLLAPSMAKTFKNFIAGKWVAPSTGEYFENRNPADTRDLIGRFPDSGRPTSRRGAIGRTGLQALVAHAGSGPRDVLRRVGDLLVDARKKLPMR
jgi:aldehyde dehydrogenase (NAD+)